MEKSLGGKIKVARAPGKEACATAKATHVVSDKALANSGKSKGKAKDKSSSSSKDEDKE